MLKLSVIIPVYNIGDKLHDALDSIRNQTLGFENIEVIFVDDCSIDNSSEIIEEFSDSYDNVKSVRLDENSGFAGKPRNLGIRNATTDYLMFLDPDDMFLETACETLYGNIADTALDVVSGNYIWNHGDIKLNNRWHNIELTDGALEIRSIDEEPNLFALPPSVWTKIFRREFVLNNDITFPEGIPGQDFVFVVNSLLRADGIRFVDVPVINYFQGTDEDKHKSVTSNRTKKLLFGYITAFNKALELFEDREEFHKYALSTNLPFWVKQLSVSNISANDKIDAVRYARPLFVRYGELDNLNPPRDYEAFFERVVEKDYHGAVGLCERIALNLPENDFNIYSKVKEREIILLNCSGNDESIFNLAGLFGNSEFSLSVLDVSPADDFRQLKNRHPDMINCFEYYAKRNSLNPDCEDYRVENSSYYTSDGFNYLTFDLENDRYELYDRFNNGRIYFEGMNDFYDYFISQHCLNLSEKPFLISAYSTDYDIRNVDSSLAHKIEVIHGNLQKPDLQELNLDALVVAEDCDKIIDVNSNDAMEWQDLFKRIYLKERNDYYDRQDQLDKLNIENKQLKEKLDEYKKVNDELLNSTSWKITKPLRSMRKLKR
ncbi:glycosyltransferase family 2 protein [Methanobrevibacter sp.]|uniref:glycosyltransferase family 2 protein n=1 Tax=Methanobrevibacter sp. TaxID=66852 RepID=UPI00388F94CC